MVRDPKTRARPDVPAPAGPVRTCVGCRQRAAGRELLRVVAGSDADGVLALVPDPDRREPGRGAHLHPTTACFELAMRRKAFPRALRLTGTPAPDLLAAHLARTGPSTTGTTSTTSTTDPDRTDRNWSTSS